MQIIEDSGILKIIFQVINPQLNAFKLVELGINHQQQIDSVFFVLCFGLTLYYHMALWR